MNRLRILLLASLMGLSGWTAGSAAEPVPPGPVPEAPKTTRVDFGKDLAAEFDAAGRLTVRRGDRVLIRSGGIRLIGTAAQAGQDALQVESSTEPGGTATWSLGGEKAPGNPRLRVRAFPAGQALVLAWETSFRAPSELKAHGYGLELPAGTWAGRHLRVGDAALMLPATAPAADAATVFDGPARSMELIEGGGVLLRVLRDAPARLVVRDLRADGQGDGFSVTLFSPPALPAGAAVGRFALALMGTAEPIPPLAYGAELWPPASAGGPLVAELACLAEYRSPFNPAEVAVDALVRAPDGTSWRQPAFYFQRYRAALVKETAKEGEPAQVAPVEREVLTPQGGPCWRALVSADQAGRYDVTFEVRTPAGKVQAGTRPMLLAKAPPEAMGPLRAAEKDRRYLADPAGRGVFLLGHNLAWVLSPRGTAAWTESLEKMRASGLNYARVWMATWSLSLETSRPYAYDLENAWRLDRIMEEAAARGIHVQLCLDNAHDFAKNRDRSPYFLAGGGGAGCQDARDFFTSEAAGRMHSARLRYLAARWGHCRNLLAWELWNELDYCVDKKKPEELAAARKDFLVPWARRAARELAELDRSRHLVTCSLADAEIWPELAGAPEIGLAESHLYLYMPEAGKEARTERAALAESMDGLKRYGKPALISEYGFGADGGPKSAINEADKLGVHLHNGLWLTALSGQCGAVALWWWDSYLGLPPAGEGEKTREPAEITGENRYAHYRAVSNFLRGTDWLAGWKPLVTAPPEAEEAGRVEMAGLRTDQAALFWLQDPANNWYNRSVKKGTPAKIEKASFTVDGLTPGEYLIEWWDAYAGFPLTSCRQRTDARGALRLEAPAFTRDVAGKLRLVEGPQEEAQ